MGEAAFGAELRQLREERGLSLKKLGRLVHYDAGYLSKIENGLRPPTGILATACDQALDAGRQLACWPPRTPKAGSAVYTRMSCPHPRSVEKAKRRELVVLAAALAFGDRLDEPVEQIVAAVDEPQVPTRVRVGDVAYLRTAFETAWTQAVIATSASAGDMPSQRV